MCRKRNKLENRVLEFMDSCGDGDLELAKQLYDENVNKLSLLTSVDNDKRTVIHLVSC
jgi:hypothetical protein